VIDAGSSGLIAPPRTGVARGDRLRAARALPSKGSSRRLTRSDPCSAAVRGGASPGRVGRARHSRRRCRARSQMRTPGHRV